MELKTVNLLWSVSLFVIGIVTIIFAATNLAEIELPDMAVRVLGVVDLVALPILLFSSVKKLKNR